MELKLDFKFDAAHRLMHHKGLCHNIHGHTWKVRVTLLSVAPIGKKDGMIADFSILKDTFKPRIDYYFDHGLILNMDDKLAALTLIDGPLFDFKVRLMEGEPTCENIAKQLFMDLLSNLNTRKQWSEVDYGVKLQSIQVWESEKASAIYNSDDFMESIQ